MGQRKDGRALPAAMADIALVAPGVADAPEGYQIPGAQEIIVKAVTANYDGTNAVGPFVPTLQVIAPNGAILASCPTPTSVAAGGSADVSWFPRSGLGGGSPSGGGIQFDTENEGDWLTIQTDGIGPEGGSILLNAPGGNIQMYAGSLAGGSNPGFFQAAAPGGGFTANDTAAGGMSVVGNGDILIDANGASLDLQSFQTGLTNAVRVQSEPNGKLSFFGSVAVVRQATPTTLPQVIALLQAYGLC